MRNYAKQAVATAVAVLLFTLLGFNSMAQQLPKADNSVHDKMYQLTQQSTDVILPSELINHIYRINADQPNKEKIIYAQLTVLKVMYNSILKKEDIIFFGNQLMKNKSKVYMPIHSNIKKVLDKL